MVGCEPVPSSVPEIQSLRIGSAETMSSLSIPKGRVSVLEPTRSSNSSQLWELELQLASKNSEFDEAVVELGSTEHRLHYAEHAVSLTLEQVQSRSPQPSDVEAACIASEVEQAAVESSVHSVNVSLSSLQCEVEQLAWHVVDLSGECDGLQVRFDVRTSQLLGATN